jgi:hypothetical protein
MTPPRGAKRPPPPSLQKIYFNGIIGKREMSGISIYQYISFLSNNKKIFIKKREDVWIRWNIRFLKDVFYLVSNSLEKIIRDSDYKNKYFVDVFERILSFCD